MTYNEVMPGLSPFPKVTYERNAEIYKLFSSPKRLEILNILKLKSLSVEQLRQILKLPKANLSQHLALLRRARLVTVRQKGQQRFYQISDPRIVEPCRILHDLWKKGA